MDRHGKRNGNGENLNAGISCLRVCKSANASIEMTGWVTEWSR